MKSALTKVVLIVSSFIIHFPNSYAGGLCDDIRLELEQSLKLIPAPGATLSLKLDEGPRCSLAAGFIDIKKNLPARSDSQYRIWSVSKTFTAAVILQLVDEGRLQLTDTLASFEKKFPKLYFDNLTSERLVNYPGSERIQIHHLLSHSSGIIDYMTLPEMINNWQHSFSPGALIHIAAHNQTSVTPGSVAIYSNTAFLILGRIIESITNDTLQSQIRKRILSPLGLEQTYFAEQSLGWGPVVGYNLDQFGHFQDVTDFVFPAMAWATGSLVSTSEDLTTWYSALLGGKVLSSKLTQLMFTPGSITSASGLRYGLGIEIISLSDGSFLMGHGGGPLMGNTATMLYFPKARAMVTVLANGASENAGTVLGTIAWKRIIQYRMTGQ